MKILAVSDVQSLSLEKILEETPEKLKNIDIIISCGDLEKKYLEFLVDVLNKEFFFVPGNHLFNSVNKITTITAYIGEKAWLRHDKKNANYIAGRADLHGRIEVFKNYIMVGFGGSMWYNGNENQYTEKTMAKIVNRTIRKILWYQLQDKVLGRSSKKIIVISHASPAGIHDQEDVCHQGFKCFYKFIEKIKPLLWLHGHIHLPEINKKQVTVVKNTTIVNAFGCKIVDIDCNDVSVYSHCGNIPKNIDYANLEAKE